MTSTYKRNVDHAVFRDGQALVMVGDTVMLLGPVAAAIVEALVTPLDDLALHDRVVATLGDAPDNSKQIIHAALADLMAGAIVKKST